MILLIPTNDGFSLASDFEKANAFRYMSVENGHIKEDEIRRLETKEVEGFLSLIEQYEYKVNPNPAVSNLQTKKNNESENIGTILTLGIPSEIEKIVLDHHFDVILTPEHNITNAVLDYINHYATNESDYCCSP